MAGLSLTTTIPKCGQLGAVVIRNPWSSRVFAPVKSSYQAGSRTMASGSGGFEQILKHTKPGTEAAKGAGEAVADDVTRTTKHAAGKASEASQDLAGKAKQTAQDAWGTVVDTTKKIKDTVVDKADESKETIKENAEAIKRNMNS